MVPHTVFWNGFCWTFFITLAIVLIWSFAMKFLLNSLHQKTSNLQQKPDKSKQTNQAHPPPVNTSMTVSRMRLLKHTSDDLALVYSSWLVVLLLQFPWMRVLLCSKKNPHTHNYCHKWVILFCSPKGPVWSGKGDSSASLTDGSLFLSFSPLLPLSWAQTHSLRLRLNEYNRN